jgi:ATP-dependent DNA helicase RecG
MATTLDELQTWLGAASEGEHLEFKEAKSSYHFEKLVEYCVALANEGGGRVILGVTDRPPRRVVGTGAFAQPARTQSGLFARLHLRVDVEEFPHPDGRVLIFHVPSHPIGTPVQYEGRYLMRVGDELLPMTPEQLRRILDEITPDFSAEVCAGADLSCLMPEAVEALRRDWHRSSGNDRLLTLSTEQLLTDAGLLAHGRVTNAAMVLMGSAQALRRHQLGQAEIIFEYRANADVARYDDRMDFQNGFLAYADAIWAQINLRNEVYQLREGLLRRDIPSFEEVVVREALLNAVAHRDYRLSGSVFVLQSPHRLEVESPGGFLPGVGPDNIISAHAWRNRLIAETLEKCGYVERSGQGVNLMFEASIRRAKLPPDYSASDDYNVRLVLSGQVQDESFIRFLEKVGDEKQRTFSTEDYLVLDHLRRDVRLPHVLHNRLARLREFGVVERTGPGRARHILSREYYEFIGRTGEYTRTRGLDKETNRQLLLKHIQDSAPHGAPLSELRQVLPALSRPQVQWLVAQLKREGRVYVVGKNRGARWHPGTTPIAN